MEHQSSSDSETVVKKPSWLAILFAYAFLGGVAVVNSILNSANYSHHQKVLLWSCSVLLAAILYITNALYLKARPSKVSENVGIKTSRAPMAIRLATAAIVGFFFVNVYHVN